MEKGAPRVRSTEYGVRSVSSSNDPSLRTPYSVLRTLFRPLSPLPSPSSLSTSSCCSTRWGCLSVATWLRCHALGNVPGVNGDEAWYGVRAWWLLHGGAYGGWHTPTGNPLNPLFVGPLALLHLWLPPSIALLRSVAVAGGLAALAINWLLCRWVFDRRTAAISTLLLAVLPINIAYSRFAWDASQSLAATLPVVYLALAAVRFPERFGRWIAAAILAQAVAVWVHPTNVVAGAVIAIACLAQWRNRNDAKENDEARMTNDEFPSSFVIRHSSFIIWSLACLVLASWIGLASLKGGLLAGHTAERLANIRQSAPPTQLPAVVLYPRLFTGGTTYRYIAGSRSWFEWPLPADLDGWGLDVGVFWLCVFGSAWLLWRGNRDSRLGLSNRVLLAAWALTIAAFMLIGGPQAMAPGQERFALCLVAPTIILLARGASLAWEAASTRWRVVLAAATLAGWPLVADFHAHYFRFIERLAARRTSRSAPRRSNRSKPPCKRSWRKATVSGGSSAGNGGIAGRFVTWHCPIAAFACRIPRKSFVRTTIGGRWPKGGCGLSSSAAQKSCSRQNRNWPTEGQPAGYFSTSAAGPSFACSMPAPSNVDTFATIVTMGQTFLSALPTPVFKLGLSGRF